MDYKLTKVKRGTFFNHDIELKYYSTNDDKSYIKEFVKLYIDEKIVFKGDLNILLDGNVEAPVFKKYMIYLISTPDVDINKDTIVEEYTNSIDWYNDPATNYKLVSDLKFRVNGDEFGDRLIKISYFKGNRFKYNMYIISHDVTGEILGIYNYLDSVIEFMRSNTILSIREFINCVNTFKSWEKLEENKILPINITKDIEKSCTCHNLEKLNQWFYKIPYSVEDARHIADRKTNNYSTLSFTDGDYDGEFHKYKKLGEKEEVYEELRAVRTSSSTVSFILLNSEENKLYVTIPYNTLKDQFGISFYYDDKGFLLFNDDNDAPYHKLFDVFYDEDDRWAYVCLSLNTIFTDDNIIKILPDGMLEYINEKFGMFLEDIFSKYEEFKENEEEYVKVATSLDKEVISDFLGLNKYVTDMSSEDDLLLDEYIKIKKILLNK